MATSKYLFVYGTLLKRHAPPEISQVVDRLRPVGPAKMSGRLYDLGEYPAAIAAGGSENKVSGQIFELPDDPKLLRELDEYEGYDPDHPRRSLFVRKRRFVTLGNGRRVLSWVYMFNRSPVNGTLVNHGNYSRFKSRDGRRAGANRR